MSLFLRAELYSCLTNSFEQSTTMSSSGLLKAVEWKEGQHVELTQGCVNVAGPFTDHDVGEAAAAQRHPSARAFVATHNLGSHSHQIGTGNNK